MPGVVNIQQGVDLYINRSDFPQYVYGLLHATYLAQRFGLRRYTAIELGVAGGNGLVELERIVPLIATPHGIAVDVVGFDLGDGMPRAVDYRDMPYIWQPGFFRMDEAVLRARLKSSELLLGDVATTGPEFMATDHAPIGFISFDLDYYSSTVAAMNGLLESAERCFLPRVLCYFDDTVGPHEELHSEFTGELLAIREFNESHRTRKLAKIHGLRSKLVGIDDPWVEAMYVLHLFEHLDYNRYVYPDPNRQFPLNPENSL